MSEAQCPFGGQSAGRQHVSNRDWWPNQLRLDLLHQHSSDSDPMDDSFDYAKEFESLDLPSVKQDIVDVMTTSQPWWPADYGHYGPLFIRMAWHGAGTYRIGDGRGGARTGTLRYAPLNSWPDNANIDKARRVLWPVKQKYGRKLSWSDLMILAGNCAIESMGGKTFGFSGGREDIYEAEEDIYWGSENEWLGDERYSGERDLEVPLGAVQMGLIYVNPQGPNGTPDPVASGRDIRETFRRMAMNDEETVALVAGGHTFGKCHGAGDEALVGREPEGADIAQQGLGWASAHGNGNGSDAITSGIEGAWTPNPVQWDNGYFDTLFGYEWELSKSPAGAHQWTPKDGAGADTVPDAHDPNKRHAPIMTTADMAMRMDPIYEPISRRFHENPDQLADAFARAWFKLTHRDMGPRSRYVGSEVPDEDMIWQDPIPQVDHELVNQEDIDTLKANLLDSGLSIADFVSTAWGSACTFRSTDLRGGANGARIRLAPQNGWEVNEPERLARTLGVIEGVQKSFNESADGNKRVSIADLIVLGGCAAIEKAASNAGYSANVPFTPGRNDAIAEQTDEESFAVLEPTTDGFRNYVGQLNGASPEHRLIGQSQILGITAPEMTVLVGGMRALNANYKGSAEGVLTSRADTLSNDFFVDLLDMSTEWVATSDDRVSYEGRDRSTGEVKWTASRVDLIFGSNSQLRALAEVYGSADAGEHFVNDFVAAWAKVMNLDRFDVA